MTSPTIVNHDLNDGVIALAEFESQLLTMNLSGTSATVTDTTTYAVTDQDTKTEKVTITDGSGGTWDGVEQTVTFAGAHTTAAAIAASMNDQLDGCSVAVVGGQVKITTDATGKSVTVAIGTGTADLTWDTPVAGTGESGVVLDNTLLALDTSTLKLVPYVKGGSTNGNGVVYGVLTQGITATASGDTAVRVALGPGLKLLKAKTIIQADAASTNIDATVKALCLDKGINLIESTNLHTADNS